MKKNVDGCKAFYLITPHLTSNYFFLKNTIYYMSISNLRISLVLVHVTTVEKRVKKPGRLIIANSKTITSFEVHPKC